MNWPAIRRMVALGAGAATVFYLSVIDLPLQSKSTLGRIGISLVIGAFVAFAVWRSFGGGKRRDRGDPGDMDGGE